MVRKVWDKFWKLNFLQQRMKNKKQILKRTKTDNKHNNERPKIDCTGARVFSALFCHYIGAGENKSSFETMNVAKPHLETEFVFRKLCSRPVIQAVLSNGLTSESTQKAKHLIKQQTTIQRRHFTQERYKMTQFNTQKKSADWQEYKRQNISRTVKSGHGQKGRRITTVQKSRRSQLQISDF